MTRSQLTLAGSGFEKYTKTTRRVQFLAEMERVVPGRGLCARIEPVHPNPGNGRPPVGLERMLRMYFLQHWFNLSDRLAHHAGLRGNRSGPRAGAGRDHGLQVSPSARGAWPGEALFEAVTEHLRADGVAVSTGTIVDATIIAAWRRHPSISWPGLTGEPIRPRPAE